MYPYLVKSSTLIAKSNILVSTYKSLLKSNIFKIYF